jgi:hypothetical protein
MTPAAHLADDSGLDPGLRCEDCSRARRGSESGWVQVAYLRPNGPPPDPVVLLYYCPSHAAHFDPRDPKVVPVPVGA